MSEALMFEKIDEDDCRELMIGMYHSQGGCDFEFPIHWVAGSIQLHMWSDTWEHIDVLADVFQLLDEIGPNMITRDEFAARLMTTGYIDRNLLTATRLRYK